MLKCWYFSANPRMFAVKIKRNKINGVEEAWRFYAGGYVRTYIYFVWVQRKHCQCMPLVTITKDWTSSVDDTSNYFA